MPSSTGRCRFEKRLRLGPIPLRGGLEKSTNFYRQFQGLQGNHPEVDSKVYDDLWDEFVKNTVWNESRIFGAFTNTPEEREMLDKNSSLTQIRVSDSTRDQAWLHEHGTCADHIREGVSTIRQAGRGAFATRSLPEGAVVSAMPLIQIINKNVLEMYTFEDIKTKKLRQRTRIGYQMIINYCYGHLNSTMLLCPYGPIVNLVNHNQTRANVKLKWADPDRGNHEPEMLAKAVNEFEADRTAKLAMELVAIRDILEGEEILLDYGDSWERAWQKHVEDWNIEGAENYVSSYMLNAEEITMRTEYEQLSEPYPGNINLECDSRIWKRINETLFHTTYAIDIIKPDNYEYWTCDVLRYRVVNGTTLYTVVVTRPKDKKKKKTPPKPDEPPPERYLKLIDIPRMAIRFTDRPYTSDMFLQEAFRHHIGIPDSLFPKAWMNFSPM
jgi:SET domain